MSGVRYSENGTLMGSFNNRLVFATAMLKLFYFVLLTFIIGVAVVAGSTKCAGKTGTKNVKINKKLAGGTTAPNNSYKYAARMTHRCDKSLKFEDPRNGGCSGAFVSFSAFSDPNKCGGQPTKYFFVTAAHCFNRIIRLKMRNVHFGLSKRSTFYTVRGGSIKLTFEQLRNEVSVSPTSELNPNAKYVIVDTTINTIRIPIDYNLNEEYPVYHADVAFMELSQLLYNQIVAKGGEFVKGQTNAYTRDRKQLGDCVVVSMQQVAKIKGTQIAAVDRVPINNSTCGPLGKDQFECWVVLGNSPGKKITYIEGGDSGGPFVCKSGQNEYLMTVLSARQLPDDIYVLTAPREKVRFYLEKAFYDDTDYKYFEPDDKTASVFFPTKQAGYIHNELKR